MRFAPSLVVFLWLCTAALVGPAQTPPAATRPAPPESTQRQRLMVDRYEQLLLRRPRPGTALDRLYAFHATAGTLAERIAELTPTQQDDANAGNRWLLVGLLQQRSGDQAAAVKALQNAEQQLTDDPMASFLLGTALQAEGETQPAIDAMQRALQREPMRTEALPVYLALGQLYYRQNQDDDAEQLWTQLVEQFGEDLGILRRVAQLMVDQQRLQPAIERYEQLASLAPPQEAVTFRLSIARLKQRLGKSDDALADLQALLPQVRPGSWLNEQVQRQIEDVLLSDGGYEKLTQYYAAEHQQHPEDVDLGLRLGQAQTQAKQYDDAAATLRTLLERTPDSLAVREALVEVLTHQKNWAAVAEQYAVLAEQHPDHTDYLLQWGTALLQDDSQSLQARRAAAANVWQRFAEKRSDDPVAQVQIAERLAKINHREQAESLLRAAIRLAPDDAQYREYLGKFFYENGQQDEALVAWNSIAAGPQPDRDSLLRLAEVLSTFGLRDESFEAFAAAAKFDLNLPQRLLYVRRLTEAQRFDEAVQQWRQADRIAESGIEQQQSWQQRVEIARAAGTLPELIQDTEKRVASDSASSIDALRLATLLVADNRPHDAANIVTTALDQSPQNIELLRLAADLFVQTQQPSQAINSLRQLADIDPQTRLTTLRRVIDLYLQEGQLDDALQLARQLVDQQPDNAALWLQYADLCFQSAREQTGYEALRTAVRAAPRDPDVLSQLGSRLASDYRTDEAIETFWQQWEAVDSSAEKIDAVAALAPLYDRQLRIEQLLERLRSQPTSRFGDAESITHQIAIVHEVTGNPGAALRTLDTLRIDQPRNTELLQKLIHLASLAEDTEQQLAYYENLLAVDRSAQTEQAFLDLLVRTRRFPDLVTYVEQSARGLRWDSVRRGIDALAAAKNVAAAINACQQVLEFDSNSSATQFRLAVLSLFDQDYDTSVRLTQELLDGTQATSAPDDQALLLMLQIANMSTVESDEWLKLLTELPELDDQQLRNSAIPLYVIAQHRRKQGETIFRQWVDFDELATSSDLEKLWSAYITTLIHYRIHPPSSLSLRPTDHREPFALVCRMAQLGDQRARAAAIRVIANRRAALSSQWKGAENAVAWYLDESQLQWLEQQLEQPLVDVFQGKPAEFVVAVANEFRASVRPEDVDPLLQPTLPVSNITGIANATFLVWAVANQTSTVKWNAGMQQLLQPLLHPTDVEGIADAIQIASNTGQTQGLLPQLPQWQTWLREVTPDNAVNRQSLVDVAMQLSQLPNRLQENTIEQHFDILATVLAAGAAAQRLQPEIRQRWEQPLGRISIGTSSTTSLRVSPLLGQPLSVATMRLVLDLDVNVTRRLNEMLLTSDPTIPADEQKLRLALASAERQWSRDADRERSLELLKQGIERFPDDDEFRIAFALQAERLQQQPAALEQLELAQPVEPVLIRLKELSRLRLASYLADADRGRSAAERLQTIPLDRKTKMIVTGQLMRLGLDEHANKFLAQTTPTGTDKPASFEAAKRFVNNDNQPAAAEAAYDALRRGTAREKQQAIQWLADLEVLPEVLQYLESRQRDNPKAWQMVDQLASINMAMGRTREATALRAEQRQLLRSQQVSSEDAGEELQAALDRSVRREFPQALEHFFNVFALDARVMEDQITPFVQAAQNTRRCDDAFQQLAACDLTGLSFDALRDLMDLDPAGIEKPTTMGSEFMKSLLINSSAVQLGPLLRELSRSNRLADQAANIAAASLKRLFSDQQTFRSDAEVWTQGQVNTDGEFIGSMQPIIAAVRTQGDIKQFVLQKCEAKQSTPAAFAVAITIRALLSVPSANERQLLTDVLAAEHPKLDGPFAWQAGQLFEQRDNSYGGVVVAMYRLAADDEQLPEAYRWTAGGVGEKLFSYWFNRRQRKAAREWLLKDFDAAFAATLTAERRSQRLGAVAARLKLMGYPLEAYRVEDALAYFSNTAPPQPDFSTAACAEFLSEAFSPDAAAAFELYELRPHAGQEPWRTSLVSIAVKQLADDIRQHAAQQRIVDKLKTLDPKLNQNQVGNRLAAEGLQAIVAMAFQDQHAVDLLTRIVEQFPAPDASLPDQKSFDPKILGLWTVASIAVAELTDGQREQGLKLLTHLLTAARHQQAHELSIAIVDRMLEVESPNSATAVGPVLQQMIEVIGVDPSDAQHRANLLNRIAAVAARHGLPDVVFEALHDVLQLWRIEQDTSLDMATQRPNTDFRLVTDTIRRARQLVKNADQPSQLALQLMDLLAPEEHPDRMFLYVLPTIGSQSDSNQSGIPSPLSLAGVWAAALPAEASTEEMTEKIKGRRAIQPETAEILLTLIAIRSSDTATAKAQMQAMFDRSEAELPELDQIETILNTLKPWTKTIQAMRQTEQVCRQADRWLIPLSMTSDTPELQEEIDRALLRVAAMLIIDGGAKQSAQSQIQAILESVIQRTPNQELKTLANEMRKHT